MNLQRARGDNLTVCYRTKQLDVSFSCVCPVIDNELRHINIVKAVCGSTLSHSQPFFGMSRNGALLDIPKNGCGAAEETRITRLLPRGSTATLTML